MKNLRNNLLVMAVFAVTMCVQSCSDDDDATKIHDVDSADKVTVDRFSATAGMLMVRNGSNGLPAANAAIDFNQAPFITKGKGPNGEIVEYYNFDVKPSAPAPIYVLFKEGASTPVPDQLNIIDALPGEPGYNDFWLVTKVTVPANYKANEVASLSEIISRGYPMEATTTLVNCPVVPEGSTATKRLDGGSTSLIKGWYKEKVVSYFTFDEKSLVASGGSVPTSLIYVCFNINPDEMGGGPASGFKVETGTAQTHNILATLPSSGNYSPLWYVDAYDNVDFQDVSNLMDAEDAMSVGEGLAKVNCPVVSIE